MPLLWAVHISANVLSTPWWVLALVVMAALMTWGSWRIREDEIPRVALMTAVFFVASQIHVRIGLTTVHLLLGGLAGLMLGRRACLAIPVGVVLQAVLLGHGDPSTVGINSCIMTLPALCAGVLYRLGAAERERRLGEATIAVSYLLLPWSVLMVGPLVLGAGWLIRKREIAPEFRGGFVAGAGVVVMTVLLQATVLVLGGSEDWRPLAALSVAAHIPVALVEGMIVGFAVEFVARVRPQLLRLEAATALDLVRPAETVPLSEPPIAPVPR